eukprot:TRINITY_DN5210_c0_g1_i4.p1 TRINITY_DN5210_c0_g1~~TRINITY_DN5210_c0_g1_i4.p1  ORF type:complete len:545 (+),score=199.27 TRINITY_DN5210_c0_g1_i4:110-1744(+)
MPSSVQHPSAAQLTLPAQSTRDEYLHNRRSTGFDPASESGAEPLLSPQDARQFFLALSIGDPSERLSQMKLLVQGLPQVTKSALGGILSRLHMQARQQGGADGVAAIAVGMATPPSPWPEVVFGPAHVRDRSQKVTAALALLIAHSRFLLDALPGTGGYISSSHSSPTGPRHRSRSGEDFLRRGGGQTAAPPPLSPALGSASPDGQVPVAVSLIENVVDECCFGGAGFGDEAVPDEGNPLLRSLFGPKPRSAPAQYELRTRAPIAVSGHVADPACDWAPLQQRVAALNSHRLPQQRTQAAIARMLDQQLLEEKRQLKQGLRQFDVEFERAVGRPSEKSDKEPLRAVYSYYKELKREMEKRGQTAQPGSALANALAEDVDPAAQTADTLVLSARRPYSAPPAAQQPFSAKPQHRAAPQQQQHQQQQQQQQLHQQQQQQQIAPAPPPPSAPQVRAAQQRQSSVQSCGIALPCNPQLLNEAEVSRLKDEKRRLKRHLFAFMDDFRTKYGRDVKTKEDRMPCAVEYERYKLLKACLNARCGVAEDDAG